MFQPASDFLASATDLSSLASAADGPEEASSEFRVAIIGDDHGRPHVMLAFSHLQWVFEPHLAADLAAVLTDAAKQAAALPPLGSMLTPAGPSGTPVDGPR
jgi:hypothetical protein